MFKQEHANSCNCALCIYSNGDDNIVLWLLCFCQLFKIKSSFKNTPLQTVRIPQWVRKPMDVQWTYSQSHRDPESGCNLDGFELACVHGHLPTTLKGQTKDETGIVISRQCFFFGGRMCHCELLPLRSRLRAPLECCVTVRESILSVCTLLASRDTTTLCHWLSLSGLSELPFISDGPLPRSKT